MKKAILCVLSLLIIGGCGAPPAQTRNDITASPGASVSPKETAGVLSGDMQVLSDKTTLGVLAGYLKMNMHDVIKKLENQALYETYCDKLTSYYLADRGITLFSYADSPYKFSYIECDKDHVSIEGITKWGFSDIQKVFGKKKLNSLKEGCPACIHIIFFIKQKTPGPYFRTRET